MKIKWLGGVEVRVLHALGLGCIGAGCVGGGQEREVWDLSKLRLSGIPRGIAWALVERRVILSVSYVYYLGYPKTRFFFPKSKAKTVGYPF